MFSSYVENCQNQNISGQQGLPMISEIALWTAFYLI